jgi:hypothetical protein
MSYNKIEGERLNVALQKVRAKRDSSSIPATEEFEALLSRQPEGAMEALLIDFVMPMIKDASILQESRIIMLLEHLRDQMLPKLMLSQLKESGEITQLVTGAIDDEIARFSDLRERRHGGIPA